MIHQYTCAYDKFIQTYVRVCCAIVELVIGWRTKNLSEPYFLVTKVKMFISYIDLGLCNVPGSY